MRTIYLDTLICVNLFIDYIILCIIKLLLHINVKNNRIILGALLGALSTLTVLIPISSVLLSATVKILTTIAIIITAYGKATLRRFTIRSLLFLGISMILSSLVITLNLLWKPTGVYIYNNELYFDISPSILIIATAVIYLIANIYQRLSASQTLCCHIFKVSFTFSDDCKFTFETALDTGCNLTEPFSGLPVILTEESLLLNFDCPQELMRVIPYNTAAGSDFVYGFKPRYVEINGKPLAKGCYIAICNNKINGEVKSIMGHRIAEVL